jgi:ABC-type maltose transport system permease subunit
MSTFYIIGLLILMTMVMVSILTTRSKSTNIQKEMSKVPEDLPPETDTFDLYDSVYELLAKQKRYLLSMK